MVETDAIKEKSEKNTQSSRLSSPLQICPPDCPEESAPGWHHAGCFWTRQSHRIYCHTYCHWVTTPRASRFASPLTSPSHPQGTSSLIYRSSTLRVRLSGSPRLHPQGLLSRERARLLSRPLHGRAAGIKGRHGVSSYSTGPTAKNVRKYLPELIKALDLVQNHQSDSETEFLDRPCHALWVPPKQSHVKPFSSS